METAVPFYLKEVTEKEADLLYSLLIEMATYEKDLDEVQTTPLCIRNTICNQKYAHAFLGYSEEKPVAYLIYIYTYSSYLGKPSIYIEDIYIKPEYRKLGIGKKMMTFMASYALQQDCGRLDFTCLDWNENALAFYEHIGFTHLKNRCYFRAESDSLREIAAKNEIEVL